MDLDDARSFLREHHRGVLATLRRDGRPQMSLVSVGADGEGRAIVSSRETAFKVRNLRRDPRVSVCVTSEDFRSWIQVDGTASIVSLPDAMEPLVDYYRRIAGEHPDWDDYRRAMEEQQRVLVRIDIERAGPDRQG
jgi:PPOX class probable F420-dependent enzyme